MKKKFIFLNTLIIIVILITTSFIIIYSYFNNLNHSKFHISETLKQRVALIESLYKKTNSKEIVLEIFRNAQKDYKGLGEKGEVIIAEQKNDSIYFLLNNYFFKTGKYQVLSIHTEHAAPMRMALKGLNGELKDEDYNGELVYSAFQYLPDLKWGIVSKMSINEVRRPFYNMAIFTFILSIILSLVCSFFINKFSIKINKTLETSEKRFKQAILHAPFPIMLHAEDGNIVAINNAWTLLTGYSIKDIPTINDWTIKAYGKQSDDVKTYIEQLYKLDKPVDEGEYKVKTKNNETLIWDFSSAPLTVLKEEKRLVLSIAKDVTQRKKMEESLKTFNEEIQAQNEEIHSQNDEYKQINEEYKQINSELILAKEKNEEIESRYKAAFKESPDSININKIDGTYVEINEGFTNVTGYTKEDVIGIKSADIEIWVIPEDREKLIKGLKENGEVKNLESKFRCKDGTLKTALMSANIIKINNEPHILSITRDITERKLAEINLKEKSEEIETQNEEYKQINEELTISKAKAEESDRLKSAFLANMSHEIRTPMNGILGFSQLLLKPNLNEVKRKEFVEIINTNGNQLLGIINDIIDISKIEAGLLKANSTEFNLNKLIDDIEQFVNPNALQKNLKINTIKPLKDIECNIITDEIKLRQILTNLATNAIKFTDKGKIEIGYNIKNDFIELFVKDTGKGIPKEDYNTIFERFRQLNNQPKESRTGTGLGLSISKAYVELLGGKIWVESELNKETTFYFTINYNKAKEIKKDIRIEPINYNWQNKTILIADDEIISLMYYEEILKATKINIILAENGEDAINKFKSNVNIDIILMDLKMPIINGFTATKEIKKINNNVPIIAQSAYVFADEKNMAFESGCCDYISKPLDVDLLFHILSKYL